jgi:hypothetical protein
LSELMIGLTESRIWCPISIPNWMLRGQLKTTPSTT